MSAKFIENIGEEENKTLTSKKIKRKIEVKVDILLTSLFKICTETCFLAFITVYIKNSYFNLYQKMLN